MTLRCFEEHKEYGMASGGKIVEVLLILYHDMYTMEYQEK